MVRLLAADRARAVRLAGPTNGPECPGLVLTDSSIGLLARARSEPSDNQPAGLRSPEVRGRDRPRQNGLLSLGHVHPNPSRRHVAGRTEPCRDAAARVPISGLGSPADAVSSTIAAEALMPRYRRGMALRTTIAVLLLAAVGFPQVDPLGRSVLFVRGADGTGGLGQGSVQQRTAHLSDIHDVSTQPNNHGFGELANLLRSDGFTVSQWIESNGTLTPSLLAPHRVVVFGSNNRTYSNTEIAAFHAWIDAGGSALFVSDANWGPDWSAAPRSDNQLAARYGVELHQDSASGVPVMARATAGRFTQPDHAVLSGFDGSGGAPDVHAFEGEGVSFSSAQRPSAGWVNGVLVTATGFQVRQMTQNGSPGALVAAGPRDGAVVVAQKDDSIVMTFFDRNTFFNRNGTGSDLHQRDHRQLALNLFRFLASVPARATHIGAACAGSGRSPRLIAGAPELGRDWFLSLRGGPANARVWWLFAPGSARPTTLPGGCVLHPAVMGLVATPAGTTGASGDLVRTIPLPVRHELSGGVLTAQAAIAAPGGPIATALELSDAVEVRLGVRR